jgi:hypothetical protein
MRPTTDVGYYDTTNATVQRRQGELAKKYGIDGFVYHHYWFYDDTHPGPTLHASLEKMLEDGYPDLPFALNWVPVNWTATWHRKLGNVSMETMPDQETDKQLLQEQFVPEDPANDPRVTAHYKWMSRFFHHDNYIKVNGKPLLMVYTVSSPFIIGIIARFKQMAVEDGFPGLHVTLGSYQSHKVLFPQGSGKGVNDTLEGDNAVFDRLSNYPHPFDWQKREKLQPPAWCLQRDPKGEPRLDNIVGIVSSFDNTPRRGASKARLWVTREGEWGVTRHFKKNLWAPVHYHACCFKEGGAGQFILINAWNEWAEGMALEPSNVFKRSFLEIVKSVKEKHPLAVLKNKITRAPFNLSVETRSSTL